MSVAFAVFTSHPNLLRCELLRLEREVLTGNPVSCNAVGVGWYAQDQDEVLVQRFRSALELDALSRRWAGMESPALLYHAGQLPVGASLEENTQPFRYRRWMFCQTGAGLEIRGAAAHLSSSLPDFLRRQVRGQGVGELVFALFLKQLRDAATLDNELIRPRQAAELFGRAVRPMAEALRQGPAGASALNCIAANPYLLVAARFGAQPLYYRLLEGEAQCARCGVTPGMPEILPRVRAHRRRRTVAVASHPSRPSGWLEIESTNAIAIGADLRLERLEI